MYNKALKLNDGESISIFNSDTSRINIKSIDGKLNIKEINCNENSNIFINKLNISEITTFVLSILLENNCLGIKNNNEDRELVSKLLENQFKKACGKNYNGLDISYIEFQVITHYEKE